VDEVIEDSKRALLQLLYSPRWKFIGEKNGIVVFRMSDRVPGSLLIRYFFSLLSPLLSPLLPSSHLFTLLLLALVSSLNPLNP
jgi:hypothetical protein